MNPPERVDLTGAAALLGLAPASVRKYAREGRPPRAVTGPLFPKPDINGEFLVTALLAWQKHRPGQGGPMVPKDREGTACDRCGQVVERRWKETGTDVLLCKPCYIWVGHALRDPILWGAADLAAKHLIFPAKKNSYGSRVVAFCDQGRHLSHYGPADAGALENLPPCGACLTSYQHETLPPTRQQVDRGLDRNARPPLSRECWACDGTGFDLETNDEVACGACGGTGVWGG